jgi:hypothetical protein
MDMSLRFAPSCNGRHTIVGRILTAPRLSRAANDNGRLIGELMGDPGVLRATLMHFARHGLAAAEMARSQAEAAWQREDERTCRHWLAVCRQLDRRMAERFEHRLPFASG